MLRERVSTSTESVEEWLDEYGPAEGEAWVMVRIRRNRVTEFRERRDSCERESFATQGNGFEAKGNGSEVIFSDESMEEVEE
jgi:hypothetical protein